MADLPALKAEGSNKRPNVLLGITGSVAAVKGPELALRLSEFANVKVVLTKHGKRFWDFKCRLTTRIRLDCFVM